MPKIFEVGGCVRDRLLGIESKDIDFTFVLDNLDLTVEEGFQIMTDYLHSEGYTIFLLVPEMYTIRAKFPVTHKFAGMVADFVMARKEIGYIEGTRRPNLVLGTLHDDLIRRDFTVNAIAQDIDGNIIDPFDGRRDLENRVLNTVRGPHISFDDDPLRILRAIRFSITKNLTIPLHVRVAIEDYDYESKMKVVSTERIREELLKCMKYDTLQTLNLLSKYRRLSNCIFTNTNLWLKPTLEQ